MVVITVNTGKTYDARSINRSIAARLVLKIKI